jgi:hypothetical protein
VAESDPTHRDEGVAEVERDRTDAVEPSRHGATLEGQIALNGQYPQVVRSGFGV